MQPILAHSTNRSRIFYLFLFSFVGLFLAGGLLTTLAPILGLKDPGGVWYIRLTTFLQSLLMFFLPAYTVAAWSDNQPLHYLKLQGSSRLLYPVIVGVLLFIASVPMISLLTQLNKQMDLPDSMSHIEQWMRDAEDSAVVSTNTLLQGKDATGFIVNLLLIGAFTAFSEEFFFRGILQQTIGRIVKNGHLTVWLTAFVFSALHLQFYGFVPRLILGVLLGYLFLYSRNLWVPIIAHFFNNASVIVLTYFGTEDFVKKINEPSLGSPLLIAATASLLITVFILYRLHSHEARFITHNSTQ